MAQLSSEHTSEDMEVDGRLLLFGGPYSNAQATAALLDKARELGLGPDRVLCTGDLIAYCGDPQATVDMIRAFGCPIVMGNCEESLANDFDDCGCGFTPGSTCSLLSRQWFEFSRAQVDDDAKKWMARLPRQISVRLGDHRFLAVHGAVDSINHMVFPHSPDTEIADQFAVLDPVYGGVLGGHSGLPFARVVDGKLWVNSGSAGMPANDGTPRVWYALLELDKDGAVTVQLCPLDYDHQGASARMRQVGLTNGYADCLESGLWPSLDVLPEADKAATGQALAPHRLVWPQAPSTPVQTGRDGHATAGLSG